MTLSKAQIRHLRSQAHHLRPVVLIGQHGLKDSVLDEIDIALGAHELIKIRVAAADREERGAMVKEIIDQSGAELVQTIGHTAVLFRRNTEQPRIVLPGA